MIRDDVEALLREERGEDGYLFPDYGRYCFAGVPYAAASVLGVGPGGGFPEDLLDGVPTDAGTVLVVLIDGLGLEQWKRDRGEHPLLRRASERGRVTPLTSVYPSETAAAMTTFHTGSLPAEHGGIGWNVYEPRIDQGFEALPFERKDGPRPDLDPDDPFEAEPIYRSLREAGLDIHHVLPYPETYAGARAHPYQNTDELASRLSLAVSGPTRRPTSSRTSPRSTRPPTRRVLHRRRTGRRSARSVRP